MSTATKTINDKLKDQISDIADKVNKELSQQEIVEINNAISAISINIYSMIDCELKYTHDSLSNQETDFKLFTNIKDTNERNDYMAIMVKNTSSMCHGTLKIRQLFDELKQLNKISFTLTKKFAGTLVTFRIDNNAFNRVDNCSLGQISTSNDVCLFENQAQSIVHHSGENVCKFNCTACEASKNTLLYCINECKLCEAKTKAEKEFLYKKTKRDHLQELYLAEKRVNKPEYNNCGSIHTEKTIHNTKHNTKDNSKDLKYNTKDKTEDNATENTKYEDNTEDNTEGNTKENLKDLLPDTLLFGSRYYYVTLSSPFSVDELSYIECALEKNFMKLMAPSMLVLSHIYSIVCEGDNVLLKGLIKQKTPSVCISNNSGIFKNKIKIKDTNKTVDRPKNIENLTSYINKTYQSDKQKIMSIWETIFSSGSSTGDKLEDFF